MKREFYADIYQAIEQALVAGSTRDGESALPIVLESLQKIQARLEELEGSQDLAFQFMADVLSTREIPAEIPVPVRANPRWVELYTSLVELRKFSLALAKGDLSTSLHVRGYLAGALKSLQSHLLHLTWQTQMVAYGDFTQRVEFMGDFSAAFNTMVSRLQETLAQHRRDESRLKDSEQRYRLLADNSADVIWTMDFDGHFQYVSPSVERLRGYTPDEVLKQTLEEAVSPGSLEKVRGGVLRLSESIHLDEAEDLQIVQVVEQPCKDGGTVWTEVVTGLLRDDHGKPFGILGVTRDITGRRQLEAAEQDLRRLNETLHEAGKALSSSLDLEEVLDVMLDYIQHVVPYDTATIMLVEGQKARPVRTRNYEQLDPDVAERVAGVSFQFADTPNLNEIFTSQKPLYIPDTDAYPGWSREKTHNPIRSWVGAPISAQGQVIAIFSLDKLEPDYYTEKHADTLAMFAAEAALAMENARLFKDVQRMAITDPLTGIFNRRYFFSQGLYEVDRACRYCHPLSLILLDVDEFKRVNDTCGHLVGDQVLQRICEICLESLRKVDILVRYGGEEFVILLPDTTPAAAREVAERLRARIGAERIVSDAGLIQVTASFGVADLVLQDPATGSCAHLLDQMVRQADQAMYQAKQAGRDRVGMA